MIEDIYEKFLECVQVSTDTRNIIQGSLFIALKGEKFNANQFAADALEKGARYALIDEAEYQQDERFILVQDTLQTLQKLARHHRRQFDIPVLGINGTNGKTTTKELVNRVLSVKYKTLATQGNLNNHIGVPLTLLQLRKEHEIAIIELGANSVGEIAMLCEIAEPSHGLTTNIGKAHMEGFGGFEGAIRGESEQYHYLIQTRGTVFINSENPILSNMAKRFEAPLFYPAEGDYFHCKLISADPFIIYKHENGQVTETKLIGAYNFENIAAALCIGKYFEIPAEAANQTVSQYQPSNKRSQLIEKGSNTIIMDAYNANPDSMQAAIINLNKMKVGHKVAILGDMFELGKDSPAEHVAIGTLLTQCNINDVLLCGSMMEDAKKTYPEAHFFPNKEQLKTYLQTQNYEHATILLKASRGIALETILDDL
ncbi:UDP-N-acetylmuramoyl-tripeptide--D-alanyl-D-alanine ligase [Catalinimonas alkaloidigena]|uniref:UDP-N-acetylmuramoyl-tripeptide--D-alanyl-D- alanine ligase n=1 Tax=Catalinimonas alkaloidigena TaxID=1075417 RepID=UPI002405E55B|nr:UDP-N-acetylmuramoyl-tripeptide--D-alanyl-D-alanine ligase [Catalinimonas alkaloidigena]MDF9795796.1 UDP-N-acetylmuramoyl-tripeptide--D-alanyl-D-alanine ligase [Catalinimonas alkaloidigena]